MWRGSESNVSAGWLPLDAYLTIQAHVLADFRSDGFLLEERLSLSEGGDERLLVEGRIRCRGGLFIDVEEFLAVRTARGRRHVRSVRYSFHAGIEGPLGRTVFRYDNHHSYLREGHPDAHHKHVFDPTTWAERPPPEWIGEERRRNLSDVIAELRQWWEATGQHLGLSHSEDPHP